MKYKSKIDKMFLDHRAITFYRSFVKTIAERKPKELEKSVVYILLEELLNQKEVACKEVIPFGTILYRARIVDDVIKEIKEESIIKRDSHTITGYDEINSKEPPLRISSEGRNNLQGVSYLYVAEDEYTALAEVKPKTQDIISIATFKVKKELKSFNLKDDFAPKDVEEFENKHHVSAAVLMTLVMKAFSSTPSEMTCDYQVTQFVSDLVRKHGYDAISYRSYASGNKNYTIFNSCKANIEFMQSQLVFLKSTDYSFAYINSGETVPYNDQRKVANKEHIEELKNTLLLQFRMEDADHE